MRLYTKKKLHAKSPIAVSISYSVRDYDTLEVLPRERVFFLPYATTSHLRRLRFTNSTPAVLLRLRQTRSCLHGQFSRRVSLPRWKPNVNRAASTVSPIEENLGGIVNTSVPRSYAIFRLHSLESWMLDA